MLRVFVLTTVMAASLAGSATAGPFTDLVVFGDSLSDSGNTYIGSGGTVPSGPYYLGRFSNGPVWVEDFAAGLGLGVNTVAPYLVGGHNFAFGGARTGAGLSPVPGVLAQIQGLWLPASPVADPDALYVVVGGGNNMRDARSAFVTDSPDDQTGRQAAAEAAIADLISGVGFLASLGAKHILVANLVDLGATPEAISLGLAAASADASSRFNALVPSLLAVGASAGVNMYLLDFALLFDSIRTDALTNGGVAYGLTNIVAPCGTFAGSFGASCDVSFFSDGLHPSARGHQLVAAAALQSVGVATPVPEPATTALLSLAIVTGYLRRRTLRTKG